MRTLLGLYRRGSGGSGGTVGILIMRCPEVWGGGRRGGGRVLESLDSSGEEFVGLIGHIFSALVRKRGT